MGSSEMGGVVLRSELVNVKKEMKPTSLRGLDREMKNVHSGMQ